MRLALATLILTLSPLMTAQTPATTHHAHGTFTVDLKPLTPTPADGIGRNSVNKHFTGDLDATTQGEMFYAGDLKKAPPATSP